MPDEPLDPIEALKHIRTFVDAMGDGADPKAVAGNLREVRNVLKMALPPKPRGERQKPKPD